MSNRDQERRYDRNEGDDWRDQSNRGSRDWDRNSDDFRSQSYDRRDERLNSQGGSGYVGGSPYGDDERSGSSQRYPVSNWRDERFAQHNERFAPQHNERTFAQRPSGSRDWNRSVGSYTPEQSYGPDWGHARSSFIPNRDYSRDQGPNYRGNFGRDDSFGAQTSGESPYFGPRREESYFARRERDDWNQRPYTVGRTDWTGDYRRFNAGDDTRFRDSEHENWGQQLREGVQQVANRVKRAFRAPKNYKRSDERIREDVNDRLAQQYDVDPTDIEVTVASGEVTLTGTVQTRREKYLAEEIADDVGGVSEVHNQLRVRREGAQTTTGAQSTGTTTNNGEARNRNAPRA